MSRCFVVCLVVVAFFTGQSRDGQAAESVSKDPVGVELFLRVPSSLPLANAEQKLQARIRHDGSVSASGEVQFFRRQGETVEPIGKTHRIELKTGEAGRSIIQSWTPSRVGELELLVELRLLDYKRAGKDAGDAAKKTATQKVTALARPLRFHYWSLKPALRYVTAGMVKEPTDIDYWTDRGVIAQRWKGGIHLYKNHTCKTPEDFADRWTSKSTQRWPGIVIDEAGDGGIIDTILGKALVESKKRRPDGHIAIYVISPGNGDYLADYKKAADLVLVETYQAHAGYGYKRIKGRYQQAIDGGLGDKSLAVLGLGKFGVTTPQELRRQFHFLRYRFPQSRGIAFFGSMKPLYPVINHMIKQFFIGPVLRVEAIDPERLHIENIGATDAPLATVLLSDDKGKKHILSVEPLAVGDCREVDMPSIGLRPLRSFKDDVLVLGPPRLWDKEPPQGRPEASAPWPVLESTSPPLEESFQSPPVLLFPDNLDEKEKAKQITATYKLPGATQDSFEMDFDLETIRVWFYGSISMGLRGKDDGSLLNLSLYRGDYEKANYLLLTYQAENQPVILERLALPIQSKRHYRVKLYCRVDDYMRMAIFDSEAGDKLWDTGKIPIVGRATFDLLEISANNGETAKLTWDPQRGAILLRGSKGKQFVTSAYFDNLKVIGLKRDQ